MMKKIIITITLMPLLVLLIAGCSKAAPSSTPASTLAAASPSVTVPAASTTPAGEPSPSASGQTPSPSSSSSAVIQSGIPLTVTGPADSSTLTSNSITVTGQTVPGATVNANDAVGTADANGDFSIPLTLDDGINAIDVIATDQNGNQGEVILMVNVVPSTSSPNTSPTPSPNSLTLKVTDPVDGATLTSGSVTVKGQTAPGAMVSVGDASGTADGNGNFSIPVSLAGGPNILDVVSMDDSGNEAEVMIMVDVVTANSGN